jgi:PAS domain S-box-containing protein
LSEENRNRDIREYILSTAVFTSLLVLGGVCLTLLFTRRIASPIRKLVDFTRSISEDRLDQEIMIGGSSEIGDLAQSFNQMLSRLKNYRDQLEERNVALADSNRREMAIRKQAEEERDLLGMAVEQAAETIVITDTEGMIQYVNPAFEKVSGYQRDEVIGKNPRLLKSEKHDRDYYQAMWNTLTQGEVWTGTFINKRKDGELFEEIAVISPVREASGKIVNYVAVKRDVTREVQMEEQLRQSQKMEAIGKLTGGIAHDFNNLLTAINGYTELLLLRHKPGDPSRKEIEEIRKAGDRAAVMTRQLLAFSRKQILQPKVLDLNAVVSGMDRMLRRLIGEDVNLITVCSKGTWKVKVDPGQVEQVILNLAVNARDAMPGGGKLTIETSNVELDGAYVRKHPVVRAGPYVMLAVSDTGCGMDKATLSRIFEPFFTTKEPGKGTGLGLSTVYGIVKQSRGHIWVYSEKGEGATFKVYFPRAEEIGEVVFESEEASLGMWVGTETLLLAEDEDLVRDLVRTILEKNGYKVLEAHNGHEALKICNSHEGPIHLLVTDIVMPQMSGRELATISESIRPGIKVLFMSGYTENAIVHHGVLDPGTAFLQKPFRMESLTRKVREILDAPSRLPAGKYLDGT